MRASGVAALIFAVYSESIFCAAAAAVLDGALWAARRVEAKPAAMSAHVRRMKATRCRTAGICMKTPWGDILLQRHQPDVGFGHAPRVERVAAVAREPRRAQHVSAAGIDLPRLLRLAVDQPEVLAAVAEQQVTAVRKPHRPL